MDIMWSPWRYKYLTESADKLEGCFLCEAAKSTSDEECHVVYRGQHCFVILNAYPYSNGHVMVVPYEHTDELQKLSTEAANELIDLCKRVEGALRRIYKPNGVNIGMNIGKAAGAGVAGHIHMHALPRWYADANFMSVIAETRVIPEDLEVTWKRFREAMAG